MRPLRPTSKTIISNYPDPNIPFVPEITPNTLHSEPGKCYDLCHLSNDKRELSVDSLSTYDGYCPSKSMIAEQVHDEEVYCQPNNNDTTNSESPNRDTTNNNNNIGNKLLPCDISQEHDSHSNTDELNSIKIKLSQHLGDNRHNDTDAVTNNYPLHCEKLNELSIISESYKSQPKGHSFSHHDH